MAFEGAQRIESIEPELLRAEAELRTAVQRTLTRLSDYRPSRESAPGIVDVENEAVASKYQKLHERLMGYGLLPSSLAFTGFGYIKNNAGNLGQLDTTITKMADPVGFETWQVPDLGVVQSFAESGMHTSAVAAAIALLIAGVHSSVSARKTKA